MRNPVVGRKTWYGTHSKKGAETNAVLFSLVESCKINEVNPRDYFRDIVRAIHEKREIFTPGECLRMKSANPSCNSLPGQRFTLNPLKKELFFEILKLRNFLFKF
jgi:hypothetical protein